MTNLRKSIQDQNVASDIQDIKTSADDIWNAVDDIERNHVEVIDRLDKTNELLERIATSLEELSAFLGIPSATELEKVSPKLAQLLKEGRVS